MKKTPLSLFLFFITINTITAQDQDKYAYIREELGINEANKINELEPLISENLRTGIFNLNFVGDANVQNSLNSGADFTANTGIGLVLDRFWLGNRNLLRQFDLNLTVNVASTADSIIAALDDNGEVLNQRDFGSYLLIPNGSKQSASLTGNIYFNDFGEQAKKITKFISGINVHLTGSNSNWKIDDKSVNMAAMAIKIGLFHEFIPDKVRFYDGYSVTVGLSYSSRHILGDLNFREFEATKMKLINSQRSSFHGVEFGAKFRFRNIIAQVSIPLLGGDEVPGLTRSQFVTSIAFVGGFPLKLSKTTSNEIENTSQGL